MRSRFPSTARTILEEVLDFPIELIEQQLAHQVKDMHGRAYNRTKHFRKRKRKNNDAEMG